VSAFGERELDRTKQLLPASTAAHPTVTAYIDLADAYIFFNDRLFGGRLPGCLITFQRKARALGYFSGRRFGSIDDGGTIDEIALNPDYFRGRTDTDILAVLIHEMVHQEQAHFGAPSGTRYHNAEWAEMMERAGVIPSSTGKPGGARTGQRVSHYVDPSGPFVTAAGELLTGGRVVHVIDRIDPAIRAARTAKSKSKTRFCCPSCAAKVWGRPETKVTCGVCNLPMPAA
jgi:hypothetical protein